MVMLHEAGHFIAARRAGMKASEFFVGFGPRLWSFRRGETEYGVKAIPAGGYVRILGMSNLEEVDPADEPRTFRRGSTKNRLVVVLAGVTVNLIIAFLLFFIVIAGQGRVADGPSTTVSSVTPKSAAAAAGLREGDKVVAVDGQQIDGWDAAEVGHRVARRRGDDVPGRPRRPAHPDHGDAARAGRPGLPGRRAAHASSATWASSRRFPSRSAASATSPSARPRASAASSPPMVSRSTRRTSRRTRRRPARREADARPRSLIGIVDEGSQIIDGNVWALLWLLGGISLVLALFNVLPLLPFDGGHAAVVIYEWAASKVKGREVRVDFRKLMPVTAVVLAVFLTLGLSAMFLDIRQAVGN